MIFKKKAQIWISAVLYILIITSSIVLILKVGIPLLEKMKDRSSFSNAKETMLQIDRTIQEVANEGEGSQRILPVDIKDGKIKIDNNEIAWELKTKSQVLDERSSINFGNLIVSSNANVKTYEFSDHFVMQTEIEGDIFNVSMEKIGSENNFSSINTSNIIRDVYYNGERLGGSFNFLVNGDVSSGTGNGYTKMIPAGNNTNLGKAKVIAHINSSSYTYDLEFTLESFADFLSVELKNVN
ncbi:hypothetical protein GOV08_01715 [Candidatus Woesearchaeota archaeon]|nr:hypothetical protein [Candidatus Woesearchaeota archaeon]